MHLPLSTNDIIDKIQMYELQRNSKKYDKRDIAMKGGKKRTRKELLGWLSRLY